MRSHVSARTRLLFAFAAGLVTSALAMFLTPWEVAALAGWDVAAVIFEVWVWLSIWPLNGEQSAFISTVEDDSRAAAGIVLIAASIASLVGVGFELLVAAGETGTARGVMIAFAVLSVLLSWLAVHTVFTLRYAHEYHREGRGIDFKEGERVPDYRDFAYVAFTIGMTFQVSDTDVTSFTIRRTVLRHALLSYLFGIVIVAVTINVVAGLLK